MSISFVLVMFLIQLAVGMMATVAILPPRLVDGRFFKSISFWAAFFTAVSILLGREISFQLPIVLNGLFGLLSLQLWFRLRFRGITVSKGELLIIAAVGIAALIAGSLGLRPVNGPYWVEAILLPLNYLSAAMILGGFLAGMIFGHYYLVETEMPKKLLVTMASILIGVLIFRIAAVGTTLLLYKEVIHPDADFLTSLVSFRGHGIFFWERILVGLAIPAVVVAMIYATARIGSNQSATGIMYVAIAFVFIGELAARYLFLLTGIPL